ncbi:MAG: transposase [Candidatus Electrothrix sp. GW3-4]|uniref:IS66 family transposase n=1 Tax=Candidatus Electrothrix sp. GW3-4 TaxID=3126740 RepID=UPI0030D10C1C
MSPTETQDVTPFPCSCGCSSFKNLEPYYTHQHIEFPEIVMSVIHFILYKGECTACGKTSKGYVPGEFKTGFGPRFTALVGEISGIDGNSRETVQTFCSSVLGVPISLGALQKIIDRASAAVKPHYESIRDVARSQEVNYLDETTWKKGGKLHWLWVMINSTVAYFMLCIDTDPRKRLNSLSVSGKVSWSVTVTDSIRAGSMAGASEVYSVCLYAI